jgi:membrane glycosyltransferase
VRPEYFPKGFALFPTWPAQDPVLAAWVFAASMGLLVIPKLLAYVVLLSRRTERVQFGNAFRVLMAILAETILAALIAPTMMVFQSRAVTEILLGRDAGWQVQRRGDGAISRREIYRKFMAPTLCGLVMALSAYAISLPLLLWMSPVILGLVLAVPMGMLTSGRARTGGLFATPEDNHPPAVLMRANELSLVAPPQSRSALRELRQNAELRRQHMRSLRLPERRKTSPVNISLAIAREKVELSDNFDEAANFLDRQDALAVLNHPQLLDKLLRMPDAVARIDAT